jgi:hypothetical protein
MVGNDRDAWYVVHAMLRTLITRQMTALAKELQNRYRNIAHPTLTQNFLSNFFRKLPMPFSTLSTRFPMFELRCGAFGFE